MRFVDSRRQICLSRVLASASAAIPDSSTGKVTIHLNKAPGQGKTVTVAYFVVS